MAGMLPAVNIGEFKAPRIPQGDYAGAITKGLIAGKEMAEPMANAIMAHKKKVQEKADLDESKPIIEGMMKDVRNQQAGVEKKTQGVLADAKEEALTTPEPAPQGPAAPPQGGTQARSTGPQFGAGAGMNQLGGAPGEMMPNPQAQADGAQIAPALEKAKPTAKPTKGQLRHEEATTQGTREEFNMHLQHLATAMSSGNPYVIKFAQDKFQAFERLLDRENTKALKGSEQEAKILAAKLLEEERKTVRKGEENRRIAERGEAKTAAEQKRYDDMRQLGITDMKNAGDWTNIKFVQSIGGQLGIDPPRNPDNSAIDPARAAAYTRQVQDGYAEAATQLRLGDETVIVPQYKEKGLRPNATPEEVRAEFAAGRMSLKDAARGRAAAEEKETTEDPDTVRRENREEVETAVIQMHGRIKQLEQLVKTGAAKPEEQQELEELKQSIEEFKAMNPGRTLKEAIFDAIGIKP